MRAALLARANADADRIRAAAEQDGQETIDAARKQAAALLADARSQGETEGAALLAVDRARARRTARSVVLTAQRAAYDELRRQACDAVRRLLDDPARQARLAAVVRSKLGEDAVIREQAGGGLTAEHT